MGVEIFKVVTSLGESNSGKNGEFVVDVPKKDAEGKKRCGGGHSDDGGHLEAVTSRKMTREDDAGR